MRPFHIVQIRRISRKPTKLTYELPERYQNAFYLANASFFDSTNWFLHKAYESVFPKLKNDFKNIFKENNVDENQVFLKLENIVEVMDQCNSIIDVRFPVRRANGRYEVVRGFRAQYGKMVGNGTSLGGLRIHDTITRDHIKALSVISAMKNACMDIGMAGAHGGIKINPKGYTESELKNIVQLYVAELYKKGYCNMNDVVHCDINTTETQMDWVLKSLETSGQVAQAAVVSKSIQNGGVENFKETAAYGAFRALDFFLEDKNITSKIGLHQGIEGKKFIIQGLGKVGVNLAKTLIEKGAICVGIREVEAYVCDKNGINLQELLNYREERGTIENFGLSKTDNVDSFFTEDCDILVLAACHKSLVCYVAKDVKAKVILEASDGPITPSAHKILTTKSKLVIPDIYALGGANVAAYFEYLINLQQIGILDHNFLRFNNSVYSNILKNLSQKSVVAMGSHVQNVDNLSFLDFCTMKNTIDCVVTPIGNEILKNLEDQKLGLDLRSSAYSVAIRNIFKNILSHKFFL